MQRRQRAHPSDLLRVVLEVERRAEPIRVTVTDADGTARAYVGWVALIAALDELREAPVQEEPWLASSPR